MKKFFALLLALALLMAACPALAADQEIKELSVVPDLNNMEFKIVSTNRTSVKLTFKNEHPWKTVRNFTLYYLAMDARENVVTEEVIQVDEWIYSGSEIMTSAIYLRDFQTLKYFVFAVVEVEYTDGTVEYVDMNYDRPAYYFITLY